MVFYLVLDRILRFVIRGGKQALPIAANPEAAGIANVGNNDAELLLLLRGTGRDRSRVRRRDGLDQRPNRGRAVSVVWRGEKFSVKSQHGLGERTAHNTARLRRAVSLIAGLGEQRGILILADNHGKALRGICCRFFATCTRTENRRGVIAAMGGSVKFQT